MNNPIIINNSVEEIAMASSLIKSYSDYVFFEDGEYNHTIMDEFVTKLETATDKLRSEI